jgi:hypothetical protein
MRVWLPELLIGMLIDWMVVLDGQYSMDHLRRALRQFSGLSLECILDETTILNFRLLLEKRELAI